MKYAFITLVLLLLVSLVACGEQAAQQQPSASGNADVDALTQDINNIDSGLDADLAAVNEVGAQLDLGI